MKMIKCQRCGYDNQSDLKYCFFCGNTLRVGGYELDKKIIGYGTPCKRCGYYNALNAQFCSSCGVRLQSGEDHGKKVQKRKVQTGNISFLRYVVGLVILAVLVIFIFDILQDRINFQGPATPKENSVSEFNSLLETKIMKVAEKFICKCGSCGNLSLDICKCESALREREFIRGKLKEGKNMDEIIILIDRTYGGLKPDFKVNG